MTHVIIGPQHPHQHTIFRASIPPVNKRFVIAVCGRRFGKTTIGIERALRNMRRRKFRGWIIAPTRQMVKDLYWEPLKERAKRLRWLIVKNETDLTIERVSTGARYALHSGDRPERLRGRGLDDVIGDEWADMDATLYPEVIRPALMDRRGTGLFTGTPAGRNHFYEMYLDAGTRPDWARFQFRTVDNPYISSEEIDAVRASIDERSYRQELEADFVEYLGAAYSYHDRAIHRREYPFDPAAPVIVCCDFNIDPCVWELMQTLNVPAGVEYVFDEIAQRSTTIWRMCDAAKQKIVDRFGGDEGSARAHPLEFYGDYTSLHRRDVAAVESSWGIIRSQFEGWNATYHLKNNPRVVDRLNAMNALMRNVDGESRFAYSSKCVFLGKDFDMCSADDVLKKSVVGDRTHASDGVGYFVEYKHPIVEIFSRQYSD